METIFKKIMSKDASKNGAGPSLDTMLNSMDSHLANFEVLVQPSDASKPRTPFDTDAVSGSPLTRFNGRERIQALKYMVPLMLNMRRGAKMYDGKFVPTQSEASPAFLSELEALARGMGVRDIRYVRVPDYAIFKDKGIPHEYAVVFTVEMDKAPIETSPSAASQLEVMRGYKNMAVIATKMTNLMRQSGFAAYPGTSLGGITDYNHLAELAGLGANGYHGLFITPGEGARLRINTIYTNIENLPIARPEDNEHLWVRDFCAMCKKCIRSCPVDAIKEEPVPRGDGGGMQCIDHDRCRDYFAANYGCAICLAQCPFSKVGYAKIKKSFKGNPSAPQFTIPVGDGVSVKSIETTEKIAAH